jgi:flagellar hook-associated protein 3 FlgL
MAQISLGDRTHSYVLRRQATDLKSQAQRLAAEVTTGRVTDAARAVSGDLVPLAGIEGSLTRLDAYRSATTEAGLFASGLQEALGVLDRLSGELATSLVTASNSGHAAMIAAAGADAAARFDAAVATLNTRLGDRSLFSGTATARPALAPADTIMAAIDAEVAGAATAEEMAARVAAWFAAPDGFATVAYRGAEPQPPLPVSPEDEVRLDITAMDPTVLRTLQGLALGALIDRATAPATNAERTTLARLAGEALMSGQTDRAGLAARIGTAEARIEGAVQRNDTERAALEMVRAGLLSVEPYAAASELEAVQTQIETLHAITARLARLSLVDFLR